MLKLLVLAAVFGQDVQNLGADNFDTRERAEARLTYWGDLTCPLLAGRRFSDPEVSRRARRVVERTLPQDHAHLTFLSGKPLTEWSLSENIYGPIGCRPGDDYRLSWTRPDPQSYLAPLIWAYGERARTQSAWKDWHSNADGRSATRLLLNDLYALGVPPCLLRHLNDHMNRRESLAWQVMEPTQFPRMLPAE
jgi:hypothetical protein